METGDRVGMFEVLVPLQAGGMGEVYLAEDWRSGERVALKVLPERFRDNDYIRNRFRSEAEMYRKLAHPNIVHYLESGTDDGIQYVALEYIKGQNLSQFLDDLGRIPVDMALSLMLDIAYALNFAHQKGIIHRDIKPQNIMMTDENVIKLIDFGVAHTEQSYVKTGTLVVGSLCYNSPEQNQGRPVDERSDIYSLGLLFYEILTGERVLPNRNIPEIALAQVELEQKLVPPSQREVDIPDELEKMILRMLRLDPEKRQDSMTDIIKVLQPLVQGSIKQLSSEARKAKAEADRDLADTHYWKAMNLLAEQKYLEALAEFDRILNLSLFDSSHFRAQVEQQLNFIGWKVQALRQDPESTPAAITDMIGEDGEVSALQMDVLQKLHKIYSLQPHDRIREAMGNLLSFYNDQLREDPRERKAASRPGEVPVDEFIRILLRIAGLYDRIGNTNQRKIVQHRVVTTLEKLRDPEQVASLWDLVMEEAPEEPIFLQGFAVYLGHKGEPARAREVRARLAAEYGRRDEHARAVSEWRSLCEKYPEDEELAGELSKAEERHQEAAEQTTKLMDLLSRLETAQDRASAINLCHRFLEDHPDSVQVLDRLLGLQLAEGKQQETAETYLRMGKVHYERGERSLARDLFAEALHVDPEQEEAVHFLVDILQEEDPSLTDRSSSREILREVFVRLGMPEVACRDLREKLRGLPRDAEVHQRIEEIYRRCKAIPEAAAACRDRLLSLVSATDDMEAARAAATLFHSRYPEYRDLLRPVANEPAAAEDPELMALLVH